MTHTTLFAKSQSHTKKVKAITNLELPLELSKLKSLWVTLTFYSKVAQAALKTNSLAVANMQFVPGPQVEPQV